MSKLKICERLNISIWASRAIKIIPVRVCYIMFFVKVEIEISYKNKLELDARFKIESCLSKRDFWFKPGGGFLNFFLAFFLSFFRYFIVTFSFFLPFFLFSLFTSSSLFSFVIPFPSFFLSFLCLIFFRFHPIIFYAFFLCSFHILSLLLFVNFPLIF